MTSIKIIDNGVKTSESDAAVKLRENIEKSIPKDVEGEILIFTNLTLHGQSTRDVDILVAGALKNCKFPINNNAEHKYFYVNDFCTVIELKEHESKYIFPKGTDIYVTYKDGHNKNATSQNEKQKYSFIKYFSRRYDYEPRPTSNFLWLKSINRFQLASIKNGQNDVGALPNDFTFTEMMQILVSQQDTSKYYYTPENNRFLVDIYKLLAEARPVPQGLTAKTFNKLIKQKIQSSLDTLSIGKDLTVFSGKAGTGKTFFLLQIALRLSTADDPHYCLLLSYNHALVSDIRRLLNFIIDQENYNPETIGISTMYRYFNSLIRAVAPENVITYDDNEDVVNNKLKGLLDLVSTCEEEDLACLRQEWEYILIDEAQDWTDTELEIIIKLYGKEHVIAADGINQFIKCGKKQHFGKKGNRIKLGTSLRQETNLVKFVNAYIDATKLKNSGLKDNNMIGGEVIITGKYTDTLHAKLQNECIKNLDGCCYDMLFLVPTSMVENKAFKYKKSFENANIHIFDGTNPKLREQYTTDLNECRLYHYESCRGLESLITVCLNFDELIQEKMKYYIDNPDPNILNTLEERRHNYTYTWSLMPITRPVAKLVIVLKDKNSEVGQILYDIHTRYSDIVKWDL